MADRDPDTIKQEIDQARDQLASTVDSLAERANPRRIADDLKAGWCGSSRNRLSRSHWPGGVVVSCSSSAASGGVDGQGQRRRGGADPIGERETRRIGDPAETPAAVDPGSEVAELPRPPRIRCTHTSKTMRRSSPSAESLFRTTWDIWARTQASSANRTVAP